MYIVASKKKASEQIMLLGTCTCMSAHTLTIFILRQDSVAKSKYPEKLFNILSKEEVCANGIHVPAL